MLLQSVVLALGAYLVINQEATAGIIIVSSILSARALAPVDLAISQWRGLVAARQARMRLEKLFNTLPAEDEPTPLPAAAALNQWSAESRGRCIGLLPQNVELIEGTVGENIARFDPQAGADAIISAAKAAEVQELIVRLPRGYDTPVGEQRRNLSGGQQQRIALARALWRSVLSCAG